MKTGDLERNFDEKRYSDNIDILNTGLAKLGFNDNINGETIEISREITSGTEINVPHNLKGVPIGRIILRQIGNGLITDGDAQWNDRVITVKNMGPATVTFLRLFIVRN